MELDEIKTEIIHRLQGFVPLAKTIESKRMMTVISRIDDPPSYYVYLTLIEICKFPKHPTDEKSVWRTFLSYRDTIFCVEDWKRYAWSIYTLGRSNISMRTANDVYKKITAATVSLIRYLENGYRSSVVNNEFYIPNTAYKLRSMYDFYCKNIKYRLRELCLEVKPADSKSPAATLMRSLDRFDKKRRELSYSTSAAIVFFFSYVELILDACFVLLKYKDADYFGFRNKTFKERFKYIFDLSRGRDINRLYIELTKAKGYRDCILHGLGERDTLLVELPRLGLVPVSWRRARAAISSAYIPFDEERAKWIYDTVKSFEKWLNGCVSTRMVLLYLGSGFPLPLANKQRKEIISHMQNYRSFKRYLGGLSDAVDAYDDGYYPF